LWGIWNTLLLPTRTHVKTACVAVMGAIGSIPVDVRIRGNSAAILGGVHSLESVWNTIPVAVSAYIKHISMAVMVHIQSHHCIRASSLERIGDAITVLVYTDVGEIWSAVMIDVDPSDSHRMWTNPLQRSGYPSIFLSAPT